MSVFSGAMASDFGLYSLHSRPDLMEDCAELLNSEWHRSKAARLNMLERSKDELPYSLVMVEKTDGREVLVGHSRLCKVIGQGNAVLIESVVISKDRRGQGLGRKLMEMTESHSKGMQYDTIYLCTHDKQDFYQHIGYIYCDAVNTLQAQMLETCTCMPKGDVTVQSCKTSCTPTKSISCGGDAKPESNTNLQTLNSTDNTPQPPPPPPPPPPLPIINPSTQVVIYWLKKDVAK
ncbi:N-alpha-acetyltransferase 80-like [Glandiceps talaboti]